MKLLQFKSKKRYMFKVQGTYVPGGVDIDFVIIRAIDKSTATAIMKSILRHKRRTATTKDSYQIISCISLDDIKDDVTTVESVYYQY